MVFNCAILGEFSYGNTNSSEVRENIADDHIVVRSIIEVETGRAHMSENIPFEPDVVGTRHIHASGRPTDVLLVGCIRRHVVLACLCVQKTGGARTQVVGKQKINP